MALTGMAKISKELYEKRKALNKLKAKVSSTENNDTYKPGYDVRDFNNISFKDYTRMKEQANKPSQGFIGNIFGQGQRLKDDVKYIEDNNMVIPETKAAVFNNEANNRAMVNQMNNPNGFLQRQMRKNSTSGKTEQFGQNDGRIVKTDPVNIKGLTPNYGEMPGFKLPTNKAGDITGNYWSADEKSDFWKTDAGLAKARETWGEGSLPSFVKQPAKKELDTKALSDWFSSTFG